MCYFQNMEKFKFVLEALKYEQEKAERLLRETKKGAFEMSKAESEDFLGDMGEYQRGLEEAVRDKKAKLKKIQDKTKKLELESEIAELEEQIVGLSDFKEASKDAEEFTIKH